MNLNIPELKLSKKTFKVGELCRISNPSWGRFVGTNKEWKLSNTLNALAIVIDGPNEANQDNGWRIKMNVYRLLISGELSPVEVYECYVLPLHQ